MNVYTKIDGSKTTKNKDNNSVSLLTPAIEWDITNLNSKKYFF